MHSPKTHNFLLIGLLLLWPGRLNAQNPEASDSTYQALYAKAITYSNAQLFAEAAEAYETAATYANKMGYTEAYLNTQISLAEQLRKAGQYAQAFNILHEMPGTRPYPMIHVRRLGRLAAVIHEDALTYPEHGKDSVVSIIQRALALSKEHGFKLQEAQLLNEIGYLYSRAGEGAKAKDYLDHAAAIFEAQKEWASYANTVNKLIEWHYARSHTEMADSLADHLTALVKDTNWYQIQLDLYNLRAFISQAQQKPQEVLQWKLQAGLAHLNYEKAKHSSSMAAYQVLNETQQLKEEALKSALQAEQQAKALVKEEERSKTLTWFLSILGVLVLGVLFLLLRERKLKARLNHTNARLQNANEKYHMLMVESNHRIKNNLQMIISMLEYASMGAKNGNSPMLRNMSSKIHTISALHKLLYADVHNEQVSLPTYFQEIISLYNDMMQAGFSIESHFAEAQIRSERIIYFGLILNEMLSNTLEHNKAEHKQVELEVSSVDDHCAFRYCDHSPHKVAASGGIGQTLIHQLIERINGSDFTFNPENGEYQFTFKTQH